MLLAYSISTDWPQQIKIKSIEGKTECPIKKNGKVMVTWDQGLLILKNGLAKGSYSIFFNHINMKLFQLQINYKFSLKTLSQHKKNTFFLIWFFFHI